MRPAGGEAGHPGYTIRSRATPSYCYSGSYSYSYAACPSSGTK